MSGQYLESLFSLAGKTAVVIGGTGELCGAMAEGIAMAGANVVLVGRSEEKARARLEKIEGSGGTGCFIPCQVDQKSNLEALLDEVLWRNLDKVDMSGQWRRYQQRNPVP